MPLGLIQDGGRGFFHWCCNRTWQGESKNYLTDSIKAFLKWQMKMSTVCSLDFTFRRERLKFRLSPLAQWGYWMPVVIPGIGISLLFLFLLSFFFFFFKTRESSFFLDVLTWFVLRYRQDCLSHLPFPNPGPHLLFIWEGWDWASERVVLPCCWVSLASTAWLHLLMERGLVLRLLPLSSLVGIVGAIWSYFSSMFD